MKQSLNATLVDDIDYPASDGQPVGETPRHVYNLLYLVDALDAWFADVPRAFVAGNMFVYLEEGNNRRHVSPDVFVSLGIPKLIDPPRERYLLWREGKGLDVVIEITSPSTRDEDLGHKCDIYQDVLQVAEYFLFDPHADERTPALQGHRLVNGVYQPITAVAGRWPSEQLRLHLEVDGEWLRLWDPLTKEWLKNPVENRQGFKKEKAARRRAETKLRQAEASRLRAETERAQAEEARSRLELEIERLRREFDDFRRSKPE